MMRVLSGARFTDVRLYTLRIKIGTRRALALLNLPQVYTFGAERFTDG